MAKKRRTLSSFNSDGRRDRRMFKGTAGWHPNMKTSFPVPPMATWDEIKTQPTAAKER